MGNGLVRCRLRDLCDSIDYGVTASAQDEAVGPRFLRITDIVRGPIDWSSVPYVRAAEGDEARYALNDGDIVVARTGATTGYSACVLDPPDALFASYLVRFSVSKRHNPRFVGYALKGPQWWQYVHGVLGDKSAQPNASARTLADAWLDVPDRRTQDAIAEVLGALDDKIGASRTLAKKAECLAVALPASTVATTTVGAIAAVCRKLVPTAFFATRAVEHFSLPAFDAERLPIIENGDGIKSGKFLLEGATVLVSKLNPHIPRVWMATPSETWPAITSTEFVGLVPTADYPVAALWALCASSEFSSQLVEMVKGTTGSHQRVSPEDVLALEVPDPRTLGQETTETIAATVDLAGTLRRESVHLTTLRDTLLPRLLSGELRVRDPEALVEGLV